MFPKYLEPNPRPDDCDNVPQERPDYVEHTQSSESI